jgi:hypothetical protein
VGDASFGLEPVPSSPLAVGPVCPAG